MKSEAQISENAEALSNGTIRLEIWLWTRIIEKLYNNENERARIEMKIREIEKETCPMVSPRRGIVERVKAKSRELKIFYSYFINVRNLN